MYHFGVIWLLIIIEFDYKTLVRTNYYTGHNGLHITTWIQTKCKLTCP